MEVAKKIYIGGTQYGLIRLANLRKLAEKYFMGNVSALFNEAVNHRYKLDPETGEPLGKPGKKS